MAVNTAQKRRSIPGVARPFMRAIVPDSDTGKDWRRSVGFSYAGEAGLVVMLWTEEDSGTTAHTEESATATAYTEETSGTTAWTEQTCPAETWTEETSSAETWERTLIFNKSAPAP